MLNEKTYRPLSTRRGTIFSIPATAHTTFYGGWAQTTFSEGADVQGNILVVNHVPCPQCGEPRPLERLIDIGLFNFLIGSAIFLNYLFGPIVIALIGMGLGSWIIALGGSVLYFVGNWHLSDWLYT